MKVLFQIKSVWVQVFGIYGYRLTDTSLSTASGALNNPQLIVLQIVSFLLSAHTKGIQQFFTAILVDSLTFWCLSIQRVPNSFDVEKRIKSIDVYFQESKSYKMLYAKFSCYGLFQWVSKKQVDCWFWKQKKIERDYNGLVNLLPPSDKLLSLVLTPKS